MRSLYDNIFASLIRRYHCAYSLIIDSELSPSSEWYWVIRGESNRKIAIKKNPLRINPFAMFLVGEYPDQVIFGKIKPEQYSKYFTGNTPLIQIERMMGLTTGILSDGLYRGMISNQKNIFTGFNSPHSISGYNPYEFAYFTGRFLLRKYYNCNLTYPAVELFQ
jgi:hypothetical protein